MELMEAMRGASFLATQLSAGPRGAMIELLLPVTTVCSFVWHSLPLSAAAHESAA